MKLTKMFMSSLLVGIILIVALVRLMPEPIVLLARELVFVILEDDRPEFYEIHGIQVQTDIEYDSIFSQNTFDYYEPKTPLPNHPTIIWIHGGGFVGGDKADVEIYSIWLAYHGYHVISMNYELAPDAVYPSIMIQVDELVAYLQTHQQHWNLNLDNLFLAGDSAGAQIAAQFATIQTNLDYAEAIGIEPILAADQIKGILLYCGMYDLTSLLETDSRIINFLFSQIGWSYFGTKEWAESDEGQLKSVINHVDENFPSTYITDGNTISFEEQGEALVQRLESLNVDVSSRFFDENKVTTYHNYQFRLDTKSGLETFQDTLNFLNQHRD